MSEVKRHSVSGYGRQDICYNDPEGEFVYHEDYVKLKAERDALAAENVAMTSACRLLAEECAETAGEVDITMQSIKTPATDAYINSVRAEGVEMWIKQLNGATGWTVKDAAKFAAQLRAGKDGE